MPLPRFQKLPAERQQAILDHAADEFAAHGPARASINRILKAAGVSKGAFYYYFHDKDDLWLAVMHRELAPFAPEPSALPAAGSWWEAVRGIVRQAVGQLLASRRSAALLREAWRHPDPAVVERLLAPLHAWCAELLRGGQARGEVRTDLPESMLVEATLAVATAIDRWFAERWEELPPDEALALSERSLGLLEDLLRPR